MIRRICIALGTLAVLFLLIANFFMVSGHVAAAPMTHNRPLHGVTLVDGNLTTIATIPFRTYKRGTLLLVTSQEADLGAIASFSSWGVVSIRANLDNVMIENSTVSPSHGNPPLTQLGIQVSASVEPGSHTLTLTYISTSIFSSSRPSNRGGVGSYTIYPGSLTLKVTKSRSLT